MMIVECMMILRSRRRRGINRQVGNRCRVLDRIHGRRGQASTAEERIESCQGLVRVHQVQAPVVGRGSEQQSELLLAVIGGEDLPE